MGRREQESEWIEDDNDEQHSHDEDEVIMTVECFKAEKRGQRTDYEVSIILCTEYRVPMLLGIIPTTDTDLVLISY